MKAIIAKKLVLSDHILENYGVYIDQGKICGIVNAQAIDRSEVEVINDQAAYLLPGFIDVHIHGSAGMDVMDGTPEALKAIQKSLVKTGTTGFLATTMTVSEDRIVKSLEVIRACMADDQVQGEMLEGSKILGAHLEGPFISKKAKGAHLEAYIQEPQKELLHRFKEVIKLVTLAPETDPQHAFIGFAKSIGIRTSLGHTTCSYDQARAAILAGAESVTHLFNAMSGLHHRDPGLVGAALLTDVYTELIADKVHVHPDLYELIYKLKGDQRMVLITDAMRGQCMKMGEYDLGGQKVVVTEQDARLENGTLAGSILTQDRSLKNVMASGKIDLLAASKMLSENPANLLGFSHMGSIRREAAADLVVLDENLDLKETFVNGRSVYRRTP